MSDISVATITREARYISSHEPIGRAAEYMRSSGLAMLPVLDSGRMVGTVTEAAVLSAMTVEDPLSAAALPVSSIMSREGPYAGPHMSTREVAATMSQLGLQTIPIIDERGFFAGIATRADVLAALREAIRPPVIAGMATPIGVYLTTGSIRAGAGDLGLFLTGLALIAMNYAAIGAVFGLAWLVQHFTAFPLYDILTTPVAGSREVIKTTMLTLYVPIFLVILRYSPLSGYHGAEHQVVHAIENGEPLEPENVARMPRAHPRCGTNIVAAVSIFLVLAKLFRPEIATIAAVAIVLLGWRMIGTALQNYITTTTPTSKQMKSGIGAGKRLLEQYRRNPSHRVNGLTNIWHRGMLQVLMGVMTGVLIAQYFKLLPPGFN